MTMRQDASTGKMVDDGVDDSKKDADPKHPTMYVKVYAPFKVYFEGEAYSLSAVNDTGPFDILPHHHNFLCMLAPCDVVIKTTASEDKVVIKISRAILHVKADKAVVFLDV
jgi:F0F1-type ATP synthase epsilon subunit